MVVSRKRGEVVPDFSLGLHALGAPLLATDAAGRVSESDSTEGKWGMMVTHPDFRSVSFGERVRE